MCGTIVPLPHMTSWHAKKKPYFTRCVLHRCNGKYSSKQHNNNRLHTRKHRLSYPEVFFLLSSNGGKMRCMDTIFNSLSATIFYKSQIIELFGNKVSLFVTCLERTPPLPRSFTMKGLKLIRTCTLISIVPIPSLKATSVTPTALNVTANVNTVIPRLTKIIRSGITFVSRNLR